MNKSTDVEILTALCVTFVECPLLYPIGNSTVYYFICEGKGNGFPEFLQKSTVRIFEKTKGYMKVSEKYKVFLFYLC